jgi:hypothetical protein
MKKRTLIGCGIVAFLGVGMFAGLVVFLVGGIFALTRPVVDASEQFLAMLGQGRVAEAYASTADGFRAQHDEASFTAAVNQLGLTEFATASWHSRQIENQTGAAEGTVTTKSGGTRPLSIRLVREGGRWAVDGIRYGGVEVASIKAPLSVPPETELERLLAESLLGFNQGVRAKDFTTFYARLSDVFKTQTSPEDLRETFQVFIDKDVDIAAIENVKPQVAPAPAVNDQGVLVVAGHYPTQPAQVRFELKYVHESAGWKLLGLSVGVGKAPAAD